MSAGYVFADPTLQEIWDAWHAELVTLDPWTLHLFDLDHTPADGDDESDYQEASFTGYAPITLTMANFDAPTLAAFIAEITYTPPPQFNYTAGASSPVTIYGYYLLDGDDVFRFAERVVTTKTIDQGESLKVNVRLRLKTCR